MATNKPKIIFQTKESQINDIQRVSQETGMSISELCRRAVDAFIKRHDEAARLQAEQTRPGA